MNFDTPFFLCVFLPILVVLYRLMPGKDARKWLLIAASLLFYAFGSLRAVLLLVASAAFNYGIAMVPGLWWLGVGGDLALLGFYKYLGFFGFSRFAGLAAPLGISFFTFKEISHLIDCRRNPQERAKCFPDFLLYISFFPQILSGPISRWTEFREEDGDPAEGLRRFLFGLGKRVFLAVPMGSIADSVYALAPSSLTSLPAWIGAISYCFAIFFDFSSYSDMAIGLARLFGFRCPENFNHPYLADSITDFWRRWHITLSRWFRDYVYIPLGGNRRGRLRSACNKMIVFLLCGFWHGASWNFLFWGLWHGCFACLETLGLIPRKHVSAWGRIGGHLYTLAVVGIGFVFFRSPTLSAAFAMLKAMVTPGALSGEAMLLISRLQNGKTLLLFLLSTACCLPCRLKCRRWVLNAAAVGLLIACLIAVSAGSFHPFLYTQF